MKTDSSLAQSSFVHIPSTVSEKAATILRTLIDPKLLPPVPEPDDMNSWAAVQQAMESYTVEQQKPVPSEYSIVLIFLTIFGNG